MDLLNPARQAATRIAMRLREASHRRILRLLGEDCVYYDPVAGIGAQLAWPEPLRWRDTIASTRLTAPFMRKRSGVGRYLDLELALDLSWAETSRYNYCAVEFAYGDEPSVKKRETVTFRLHALQQLHTVRILVPDEVRRATCVRVTFAPAPHCQRGRYKLLAMRFSDDELPLEQSRIARLEGMKEHVRLQVAESERQVAKTCSHYPTALTLELTARCNLTCVHCTTHGEPQIHRQTNKIKSLGLAELEALAEELFPWLTVISLVGRGEPLLAEDALWNRFIELIIRHRVMLSITTNGYFLERRISPELLPFIAHLNVSMDGLSPETFATNRGGADVNRVWRNVEHFHRLRKAARLARRPRLGFAWTLKQNNIAELPDFVHKIAEYDADTLIVRHLLVFFAEQAAQSALNTPRETNRHLRKTYELLERYGIERDAVPLIKESSEALVPLRVAPRAPVTTSPPERDPCMFIHRMPVITCGGEVMTCSVPGTPMAGRLDASPRFDDIWNGPVLQGIRGAMDTPDESQLCRTCWYREAKFASQRELGARGERYAVDEEAVFSPESFDFATRASS